MFQEKFTDWTIPILLARRVSEMCECETWNQRIIKIIMHDKDEADDTAQRLTDELKLDDNTI